MKNSASHVSRRIPPPGTSDSPPPAGSASSADARRAGEAPFAPPRPLSAKASRQAWAEPRVRNFWIGSIVLAAIALAWGGAKYAAWAEHASFLQMGRRATVVVRFAGETDESGEESISPSDPVDLRYHADGQEQFIKNVRLKDRDEPTTTGDTIPIVYDPADPTRLTTRVKSPPLSSVLMFPGIVAALAVAALIKALLARADVVRIWRSGKSMIAVVKSIGASTFAPKCDLVKAVLKDHPDRREMKLYIPPSVAVYKEGDVFWIVMPVNRPDKALAARLYQ